MSVFSWGNAAQALVPGCHPWWTLLRNAARFSRLTRAENGPTGPVWCGMSSPRPHAPQAGTPDVVLREQSGRDFSGGAECMSGP